MNVLLVALSSLSSSTADKRCVRPSSAAGGNEKHMGTYFEAMSCTRQIVPTLSGGRCRAATRRGQQLNMPLTHHAVCLHWPSGRWQRNNHHLQLLLLLLLLLAGGLSLSLLGTCDKGPSLLDKREAQLLEVEQMVADDEVHPRAMDSHECVREWAHTHGKSFGQCNHTGQWRPEAERGNISELSFLLTLTVLKKDRLRPEITSLTNCTGLMVDDQLVLTHAHCVGPRTEHEVTIRIWAIQPLHAGAPLIEATRVCWSKRLWWPGAPRAPYDVALVNLSKRLRGTGRVDQRPEPVCLASNGKPGNRRRDGPEACALVQLCQRDTQAWPSEQPYTNESHWFRVHGVTSLPDDTCRREMAGNLNGGVAKAVGPRLMSCFSSTANLHLATVCPIEFGRLVFCFPEGCPRAGEPGPKLVGLGPMDFRPGEPALYKPMENPTKLVASATSVADLGTIHEQLKDLLVDARVHTHGGSVRTICRQLITSESIVVGSVIGPPPESDPFRPGEILENARVMSNAGFKGSPVDGVQDRPLGLEDLPTRGGGTFDAFDPAKCWHANESLMQNSSLFPKNRPNPDLRPLFIQGRRHFRLPFLVDLIVRKRIVDWRYSASSATPANATNGLRHEHTCDAWLISHDTVLTHAECVAPETMFDRVESVSVSFGPVPGRANSSTATRAGRGRQSRAQFYWPGARRATKVCWPRESLPPRWHRGLELAVVRFKPSVTYTPGILEPACLSPPDHQLDASCSIMIQCPPQDANGTPKMVSTLTRRCGTMLGPWDSFLGPGMGGKWYAQRYNAHHLRTYLGLRIDDNPCESKVDGPEARDRSRLVMCKGKCAERPTTGCTYLSALGLGPIFAEHPGARYTGRAFYEVWPKDLQRWAWMLTLDLKLAQRQLMELLLALRADNEGTRDVSCRVLPSSYDEAAASRRTTGHRMSGHGHRHRHHFGHHLGQHHPHLGYRPRRGRTSQGRGPNARRQQNDIRAVFPTDTGEYDSCPDEHEPAP